MMLFSMFYNLSIHIWNYVMGVTCYVLCFLPLDLFCIKILIEDEEGSKRLSTIADSYQISTLTFHIVPMTPPINPHIPSAPVRTFLISGILWTLLNVSFSIVWSDLLTYQKLLWYFCSHRADRCGRYLVVF